MGWIEKDGKFLWEEDAGKHFCHSCLKKLNRKQKYCSVRCRKRPFDKSPQGKAYYASYAAAHAERIRQTKKEWHERNRERRLLAFRERSKTEQYKKLARKRYAKWVSNDEVRERLRRIKRRSFLKRKALKQSQETYDETQGPVAP